MKKLAIAAAFVFSVSAASATDFSGLLSMDASAVSSGQAIPVPQPAGITPAYKTKGVPGTAPEPGFSSAVSPGLEKRLTGRYGPGAAARLGSWREFVYNLRAKRSVNDLAIVQEVNDFFNLVPFMSDQVHWGVTDHWASPAELLASNGGDCEDYSIAKYFALKELGIPAQRLRIVYTKDKETNQSHMVMAYYRQNGADPLILDNLSTEILPASTRTDLTFIFNLTETELSVLNKDLSVMKTRPAADLTIWAGLLRKLRAELNE